MKKYYLAIPIAAVILTAVYFLYPQENSSNQLTSQTLLENGSPLLGNPNSKITIIEWGDYQCRYCHAFHQSTSDQLMRQYVDTGKANFVFRDFPLNGPDSVLAAAAAYCADDQGKYWQYHDQLYNNWGGERTGWVTQKSLSQFANNVGLDPAQFDKCMNIRKYEQKVLDNQQFGEQIGIDSTPTFVIFTDKTITRILGAQPFSAFQQVLDHI